MMWVRQGERRNWEQDLASDAERLAAGGHHPEVGATAQKRLGKGGARRYQVLAVVQYEENFPGLQVIDQRLDERRARRLAHPQDGGYGLGYEVGIREGGQLHQPCSVLKVPRDLRGYREGQSRLTR